MRPSDFALFALPADDVVEDLAERHLGFDSQCLGQTRDIGDASADVLEIVSVGLIVRQILDGNIRVDALDDLVSQLGDRHRLVAAEIGRASCRERV